MLVFRGSNINDGDTQRVLLQKWLPCSLASVESVEGKFMLVFAVFAGYINVYNDIYKLQLSTYAAKECKFLGNPSIGGFQWYLRNWWFSCRISDGRRNVVVYWIQGATTSLDKDSSRDVCHQGSRGRVRICSRSTRWAPTNKKPYKWPNQFVTGVINPTNGTARIVMSIHEQPWWPVSLLNDE